MISKCWSIYITSIIAVSVFGVNGVHSLVCNHTTSVYGVPNDLVLGEASVLQDLNFEDCINHCCQNSTCQAAGIHKKYCFNAQCKSEICDREFTPNNENESAQFVFVLRSEQHEAEADSADLISRSERVTLDPKVSPSNSIMNAQTVDNSTVIDNVKAGDKTNLDDNASTANNTDIDANTNTENKPNSNDDKGNQSSSDQNDATKDDTSSGNDKEDESEKDDKKEKETEKDDKKEEESENDDKKKEESEKDDKKEEDSSTDVVCDPACGDNELCSLKGDVKECSCKEGYIYKDSQCIEKVECTDESCVADVHTACTVIDNTISCPCQTGYKLKDGKCAEVSCEKVTCPLHARCAVSDNDAKCFCDQTYIAQGPFCRKEVKCTVDTSDKSCPTNEACKQVSNKAQCQCVPGKARVQPAGDCTGDAATITIQTDDVTVTLPAKSANLTTKVSPTHKKTPNYYTYVWEQQSSPESTSEGGSEVAGLTKPQMTISKLVAGEYVYSVSVTGKNNEFLSKVVKLTVNPAAHINVAPVAVVKPSSIQSFKLPADFNLNGIDSTDDEKITSFAWTIDKKPVASKDHIKLEGESTDTLHVQIEAGEGEFTFKLEVKDKDGLTGLATKSVTILAEDDFPPSAKVSAGIDITLPENSAVLSGKESTDDHGVTRWEWQKSADSPKIGDMTGTTTDTLTLTNLVEGTYSFSLTVYDRDGHNSTASTTVTVRPAQKGPPVADAGSDKELIMPDRNTVLDGSKSRSPLGALSYFWELVEGKDTVTLKNTNTSTLSVTGMDVGTYRFKLTVTDSTNVTGSEEVSVVVKADDNTPPVARLGANLVIYAPNTALDIDGSNSTDDSGIVQWDWERSLTSPALGQVVTGSNNRPVLKLCDLIVGEYTFTLTVHDEKGLSDSASINVSVKSNPHANNIVQVYLFENPANFTQDRLNSLIDILMVPFRNAKQRSIKRWELVTISVTTIDSRVVVYFYGRDEAGEIMAGAPLVRHLRDTVYGKLLGFNFDIIDTSTCSNDCGGHGTCSDDTRLCTCDKFWMENFFRGSAGRQFSNCQWSKIYFGIIVSAILIAFLTVIYTVYCVLSLRNSKVRRRKKYKMLEEETGRGVNLSCDSSDEDSDLFKMKKVRKSSSAPKIGNGCMPANVLNNAASSSALNAAKKK